MYKISFPETTSYKKLIPPGVQNIENITRLISNMDKVHPSVIFSVFFLWSSEKYLRKKEGPYKKINAPGIFREVTLLAIVFFSIMYSIIMKMSNGCVIPTC